MNDPTTDCPACPKCTLPTGITEGAGPDPWLRCAACGHRWEASAEGRAQAERADAAHEARVRREEAAGLWEPCPAPPLDLDAVVARHEAAQWPETMRVHDDGDTIVEAADGDAVANIAQRHDRWPRDERAVARADSLRRLPADVRDLVAEVRRLRAERNEFIDRVWTVGLAKTGQPPASVAELLAHVGDVATSLALSRRAMLDVCEAIDGVRPEPDFDAPAELGAYACDEIARLRAAAVPEGRVAVDRVLYDAACRLAGDVPRLQREADDLTREVRRLDALAATACDEARDALAARDEAEAALRSVWGVVAPGAEGFPRVERGDDEVADAATIAAAVERRVAAAARREGAEAMREACAKAIDARASQSETTRERYSSEDDRYGEALAVSCACEDLASALRALPLPGGES